MNGDFLDRRETGWISNGLELLSGSLFVGLAFFAGRVAFAQCENCCATPCENQCGLICLDGLVCEGEDPTPMICVDGDPYCWNTPIIIDPLGQGFHLTSAKEGVTFSFVTGTPVQTSWTDPNYSNAWLALDRNGNGVIDNGTELFGSLTPQPPGSSPNGYKALAVFDDPKNGGNGNARIDPGDAVYSSLLLWIDRNHDGISQPDELFTLPEAGIFAIGLNYVEDDKTDQFGNEFRYRAPIWDKVGEDDSKCYDVLLLTVPPGLQQASQSANSNGAPASKAQ